MTAPRSFPEYGGNGDVSGARRTRRSFRLCVAACVLFAGMLWFSERYLRYDLCESQYMMALTLVPESGRPILRQVVKRDAARRSSPTPKYVAALAEREEPDQILSYYDEAYKLDPKDSFLAIRYGCQLFRAERYDEARQRFREAGLDAPPNLLPQYLEAATLPWAEPSKGDTGGNAGGASESLALIAKANSSENRVVFPPPLWSDPLPERGVWYQRLRRQIVDECCAPLYKYSDRVLATAKHQIALREIQYWDSWLATLQEMGTRLAFGNDVSGGGAHDAPTSVQATAGLHIQLAAIEQRLAIGLAGGHEADRADLSERQDRLKSALALLNQFESTRDDRIAADRAKFVLPLILCWKSVALLVLAYLGAYSVSHALHAKRKGWTLPHARYAKRTLVGGCAALLLLLAVTAALPHTADGHVGWLLTVIPVLWWSVLAVLIAFGLAYPRWRLPRVDVALERAGAGDNPGAGREARRQRRLAYVSFVRRYYGILCGLVLCLICVWAIAYRIVLTLFPWQIDLLITGLGKEEAEVVRQAMALLH